MHGYDCSSCAWSDPDKHCSAAEFCKSRAKATASDDRACGPEIVAKYSLAELSQLTDRDLNCLGCLTHPIGIYSERRVLFTNREDARERSLQAREVVDITNHFEGQTRTAVKFLAVPYNIPTGNVGAYFPAANVLVPLASVVKASNTPTFKRIVVTVAKMKAVPADGAAQPAATAA